MPDEIRAEGAQFLAAVINLRQYDNLNVELPPFKAKSWLHRRSAKRATISGGDPRKFNQEEPMTIHTYHPDDKIVIIATGEVLTVSLDLGNNPDETDCGINVRERDELVQHADVSPAGRTRQRLDAISTGLTPVYANR